MIILDTNFLSVMMSPSLNPVVIQWFDRQHRTEIATTAISILESRIGLLLLPEGRRKRTLIDAFDQIVSELFTERSFPLTPKRRNPQQS